MKESLKRSMEDLQDGFVSLSGRSSRTGSIRSRSGSVSSLRSAGGSQTVYVQDTFQVSLAPDYKYIYQNILAPASRNSALCSIIINFDSFIYIFHEMSIFLQFLKKFVQSLINYYKRSSCFILRLSHLFQDEYEYTKPVSSSESDSQRRKQKNIYQSEDKLYQEKKRKENEFLSRSAAGLDQLARGSWSRIVIWKTSRVYIELYFAYITLNSDSLIKLNLYFSNISCFMAADNICPYCFHRFNFFLVKWQFATLC